MTKRDRELKAQAKKILAEAEKRGAQSNYFFATTFKRYQEQLKLMDSLSQAIESLGMTVEKEYVKGRLNVCTNPAIAEYNRTSNAANGTVITLIKILNSIPQEDKGSRLQEMINTLNEEDE